jgi:hypothetical protein
MGWVGLGAEFEIYMFSGEGGGGLLSVAVISLYKQFQTVIMEHSCALVLRLQLLVCEVS